MSLLPIPNICWVFLISQKRERRSEKKKSERGKEEKSTM
jgi:hypothetical protein